MRNSLLGTWLSHNHTRNDVAGFSSHFYHLERSWFAPDLFFLVSIRGEIRRHLFQCSVCFKNMLWKLNFLGSDSLVQCRPQRAMLCQVKSRVLQEDRVCPTLRVSGWEGKSSGQESHPLSKMWWENEGTGGKQIWPSSETSLEWVFMHKKI